MNVRGFSICFIVTPPCLTSKKENLRTRHQTSQNEISWSAANQDNQLRVLDHFLHSFWKRQNQCSIKNQRDLPQQL